MKIYNTRRLSMLKKYSVFEKIKPVYRFLPAPLFLLVHITLKCNKACQECYQDLDPFYKDKKTDMPLEDFVKLLAELKKIKWPKPHFHIIGGEPLMHPHFETILVKCANFGTACTITTNGYLFKDFAGAILNSSLSELNISIPVDKQGDVPIDFLKSLEYLIKSKKGSKPVLNLNYLISRYSYLFLKKTVDFFNENFAENTFETFTCEHLEFEKKDRNKLQLEEIDVDLLSEQINKITQMNSKFNIYFAPQININDIKLYYQSDYFFKHTCFIPWVGLNVYPDLSVTPGGAIFHCNEIIGNLKRETILKVWRGANLRKFRNNIVERKLPEACFRCCHKIY